MTERQEEKYQRQKEENEFKRALSFEFAKSYCEKNGLSVEKLEKQRFDLLHSIAVFAQPSGVTPNGLCNDKETMPFPTLIIEMNGRNLIVKQTEYTKQYLSN